MKNIIHVSKRGILINGVEVTGLGRREEKILEHLALRHGKWVSRNELMDVLFADNDNAPYDNIISAYMSKIRRVLRGTLDIKGAYNFGYKLTDCAVFLKTKMVIVAIIVLLCGTAQAQITGVEIGSSVEFIQQVGIAYVFDQPILFVAPVDVDHQIDDGIVTVY